MNPLQSLPVNRLLPHPDNPRKDLGDLSELTESVRENGILQNLTVVPAILVEHITIPADGQQYYVVIIGHRRHAAATAAGLETVPCVVTNMDRKTQLTTMMMENVQRCDLTAYEQAQGFHQLAILGLNVAQISKQSGFSKKVVKSRLEMAQLDQKTLQKVSNERQLSLKDFDRLSRIKDLTLRNGVLKSIGTRDFDEMLAKAKKKELIACKLPALKDWLKEHNAEQIFVENTYGGRYTSCFNHKSFSYIYIDKLGDSANSLPDDPDIQGRQLYYVLRDEYVSIYIENPNNTGNTTHGKKTDAEKARDRTMREVRAKIRELSSLHYELRKDFIENLIVTKANKDKVIAGALQPALFFAWDGSGRHSATIREAMGFQKNDYGHEKFLKALEKLEDQSLARVVYAIYNDNATNWFADDMLMPGTIPTFPKNCVNVLLELLYEWLISLGYEPSTEEQALMDGSHEIYKKAKKGAKS